MDAEEDGQFDAEDEEGEAEAMSLAQYFEKYAGPQSLKLKELLGRGRELMGGLHASAMNPGMLNPKSSSVLRTWTGQLQKQMGTPFGQRVMGTPALRSKLLSGAGESVFGAPPYKSLIK